MQLAFNNILAVRILKMLTIIWTRTSHGYRMDTEMNGYRNELEGHQMFAFESKCHAINQNWTFFILIVALFFILSTIWHASCVVENYINWFLTWKYLALTTTEQGIGFKQIIWTSCNNLTMQSDTESVYTNLITPPEWLNNQRCFLSWPKQWHR